MIVNCLGECTREGADLRRETYDAEEGQGAYAMEHHLKSLPTCERRSMIAGIYPRSARIDSQNCATLR